MDDHQGELPDAIDTLEYERGRRHAADTEGWHEEFARRTRDRTRFDFIRVFWQGYIDWCDTRQTRRTKGDNHGT